MSPNGSLLAATTSGRPSFSYVRFPGQARAEDKEWLDKEWLCGGCRAGTEGEGEEEPSRGRGQRDQALEGLGSLPCIGRPWLDPLRLAKSQHKSTGPIFEGNPPEGICQDWRCPLDTAAATWGRKGSTLAC